MKIEVIKDYALPCMQAEHALKEAHQCMLSSTQRIKNERIEAPEHSQIASPIP